MTKQEYLLQQYIIEALEEMAIKYLNPVTKEDETRKTVKEILRNNKDLREKIIDDFSDVIIKHLELKY